MYDDVAKLRDYGEPSYDAAGNESFEITETTVFVQPRGVYQSEFYNAAQLGLKPSLSLYMTNKADYNGQKELEYHGTIYEVIRVDWSAQRDGITLICEERAGAEIDDESESGDESEYYESDS